MIHIPTIIRQRLLIDHNFPSPLNHKHLSLAALPPRKAIEPIRFLLWFFDFLKFLLSLFEGEEFELDIRIDDFIGEIVFIYFFAIFGEN